MTIGDNINTAREAAGLSRPQLAIACGVTRAHIWLVERGFRNPSLDLLRAIAKATGTKIKELVE